MTTRISCTSTFKSLCFLSIIIQPIWPLLLCLTIVMFTTVSLSCLSTVSAFFHFLYCIYVCYALLLLVFYLFPRLFLHSNFPVVFSCHIFEIWLIRLPSCLINSLLSNFLHQLHGFYFLSKIIWLYYSPVFSFFVHNI